MGKCFKVDESIACPNHFMITVNHEEFYIKHTLGSCNVISARVMNLSYASYLRMCRDKFKAEIYGKGSKYPIAYFKDKENANSLVKILNEYADRIMKERS